MEPRQTWKYFKELFQWTSSTRTNINKRIMKSKNDKQKWRKGRKLQSGTRWNTTNWRKLQKFNLINWRRIRRTNLVYTYNKYTCYFSKDKSFEIIFEDYVLLRKIHGTNSLTKNFKTIFLISVHHLSGWTKPTEKSVISTFVIHSNLLS